MREKVVRKERVTKQSKGEALTVFWSKYVTGLC